MLQCPSRTAAILVLLCLGCSIAGNRAKAGTRDRTFKTPVHFVANGTRIHVGMGTSGDVYLAEIASAATSQDHTLVRLVDQYTPYEVGLSSEALKSGVTLRLRRDHSCDVPYGQMILRTAPGDPEADLPERLGYHPVMSRQVDPNEVLPCYRAVR